MSFLGRYTRRVARSAQQVDDDELTAHAEAIGVRRIADTADRELAEISGDVRSLTIPAHGRVPALLAEVYDGTGALALVWLGRREIRGIAPGTRLRARGRVTYRKGVPTIFNPQYELLPRRHGA